MGNVLFAVSAAHEELGASQGPIKPAVADLRELLRQASPELAEEEYVYCTLTPGAPSPVSRPLSVFEEREGTSVICRRDEAAKLGLAAQGAYRLITLRVHSSLEAVGFLAAVSSALARAGIPCNACSAYFHDYLLIPSDQATRAMEVLRRLVARAAALPPTRVRPRRQPTNPG